MGLQQTLVAERFGPRAKTIGKDFFVVTGSVALAAGRKGRPQLSDELGAQALTNKKLTYACAPALKTPKTDTTLHLSALPR